MHTWQCPGDEFCYGNSLIGGGGEKTWPSNYPSALSHCAAEFRPIIRRNPSSGPRYLVSVAYGTRRWPLLRAKVTNIYCMNAISIHKPLRDTLHIVQSCPTWCAPSTVPHLTARDLLSQWWLCLGRTWCRDLEWLYCASLALSSHLARRKIRQGGSEKYLLSVNYRNPTCKGEVSSTARQLIGYIRSLVAKKPDPPTVPNGCSGLARRRMKTLESEQLFAAVFPFASGSPMARESVNVGPSHSTETH